MGFAGLERVGACCLVFGCLVDRCVWILWGASGYDFAVFCVNLFWWLRRLLGRLCGGFVYSVISVWLAAGFWVGLVRCVGLFWLNDFGVLMISGFCALGWFG